MPVGTLSAFAAESEETQAVAEVQESAVIPDDAAESATVAEAAAEEEAEVVEEVAEAVDRRRKSKRDGKAQNFTPSAPEIGAFKVVPADKRRVTDQEFLCARTCAKDLFDPVAEKDLSRRDESVIAAA